jgi:uncharacterized OsmC-like protein
MGRGDSVGETIIERADALKKVMQEAIAETEKQGGMRAVFRSSVQLKKNTTVEATARQFHFTMDEPSDDGGEDNGPTPEEVILAGVGACTAMTAAFYAALNDIPIKSYRIDMKGYANFGGFYGVSDKFPVGFDRVVTDVSIETDAPEEQVKQFQEMVEQRCVGHGTMMQPVAMESRWKINGKSVGGPAGWEAH